MFSQRIMLRQQGRREAEVGHVVKHGRIEPIAFLNTNGANQLCVTVCANICFA
jgi:hypothetical protein